MLFEAFLAQVLNAASPGTATAAPATPPPSSPQGDPKAAARCPPDMRFVEGIHDEYVQRLCTSFRMDHCFAFLPGLLAGEPRATPISTCMDRYEWPNRAGAEPAVMVRFVEAEARCSEVGKRLCTEFEWELACEGPETLPFPYGYRQEPGRCNTDKVYRPVSEARLASDDPRVRDAETKRAWQGEPSGAYPACESGFGVADLVGNVEEWVSTSRPEWPWRSSLKGGYWSKPWAGCRGTNERHGPQFRFYEVGFRCCKDP